MAHATTAYPEHQEIKVCPICLYFFTHIQRRTTKRLYRFGIFQNTDEDTTGFGVVKKPVARAPFKQRILNISCQIPGDFKCIIPLGKTGLLRLAKAFEDHKDFQSYLLHGHNRHKNIAHLIPIFSTPQHYLLKVLLRAENIDVFHVPHAAFRLCS